MHKARLIEIKANRNTPGYYVYDSKTKTRTGELFRSKHKAMTTSRLLDTGYGIIDHNGVHYPPVDGWIYSSKEGRGFVPVTVAGKSYREAYDYIVCTCLFHEGSGHVKHVNIEPDWAKDIRLHKEELDIVQEKENLADYKQYVESYEHRGE